jgi:N-acetylglucosamine-6-sulfatase
LKGKPLLSKKVERKPLYAYENVLPEPPESRRGRGTARSVVVGDEHRCLASVDDGVGKLFEALEKNNQLKNTIIIYVSDNGMLMGEHGEFNMKRWAYDPVLRIPMLIRYPKLISKGSIFEQMILNIDIAPTLLEIANVKPLEPMDGQSIIPLLKNRNEPWRKAFLAEYFLEKVAPRIRPWQAVRTDKWKYIKYTEDGIPSELYNLETDPDEKHNLITHKDAVVSLKAMEKKLEELLQQTD